MQTYRFMEVSMAGQPFSRMIACGVTLVCREDPGMAVSPGPGQEVQYRNHLGLRVEDLEQAIAEFEAKGALVPGPDSLWIELNEVHEPADARWFPA